MVSVYGSFDVVFVVLSSCNHGWRGVKLVGKVHSLNENHDNYKTYFIACVITKS